MQQEDLAGFIGFAMFREGKEHFDWKIEVETEGVLLPDELVPFVAQWNVSPKLANSGMPLNRRYKPEVLSWHNVNGNSFFKFPVASLKDVAEVDAIVAEIRIPPNKVFLMPVADTREKLAALSPSVIEWCKERSYSFSTRLHVAIWDKVTGV